ncbi:MAG: lysophospholipid acyltransferase family protein [Desulfobacteraceae bacterium]|jgi:1-acyl-sn-glycerol-3-phosphate acyltransferase
MNALKKAGGVVLSILMLMIVVFTSIVFFCLSLIIWFFTASFDKNRKVLHRFTCYCLAFWAYIMPTWRIKVEGREKIRKDGVYVIVANHQSQLDIVMTALLFTHFKWISKAEIVKVPILGWQMALNKYILLRRGYVNSISKMIEDCEKALEMGSSILLFPEGTRSEDGEIKPFKPGAFILAEKQKVPVLPVVIYGTLNALPKHSLMSLGVHQIRLKVLDEIPYDEYSKFSHEESQEQTRDLMAKHLNLIKKRIDLGLF